ncbi:ENTH/VHS/GAT family protein [Corchorus capsularis]|uniref:ENTH/VHS/GAT family protein n=1 Tax=Corchorus capsularis TaxID=210143 RepID=A0A1R3HA93_COCAP|nr:ENTH/VHS/GAT family protein [Corchorus capsularis]
MEVDEKRNGFEKEEEKEEYHDEDDSLSELLIDRFRLSSISIAEAEAPKWHLLIDRGIYFLQAKDVLKGIKKKLGSKNSKVQLLALTPDYHVKEKILTLIDTWQEAFGGPTARYPQYYVAYQELLHAGAVFPQRSERSEPVLTPPQTQPLSSYPPNIHNYDRQDMAESSAESEFPLSNPEFWSVALLAFCCLTEMQNVLGIMDVLAEMLNALDLGNKEGLQQEVIVDLVEQCRTYKQRVVHILLIQHSMHHFLKSLTSRMDLIYGFIQFFEFISWYAAFVYKEVAHALKINSVYSKRKLLSIHENLARLPFIPSFSDEGKLPLSLVATRCAEGLKWELLLRMGYGAPPCLLVYLCVCLRVCCVSSRVPSCLASPHCGGYVFVCVMCLLMYLRVWPRLTAEAMSSCVSCVFSCTFVSGLASLRRLCLRVCCVSSRVPSCLASPHCGGCLRVCCVSSRVPSCLASPHCGGYVFSCIFVSGLASLRLLVYLRVFACCLSC